MLEIDKYLVLPSTHADGLGNEYHAFHSATAAKRHSKC
jgi:hypothetical protein